MPQLQRGLLHLAPMQRLDHVRHAAVLAMQRQVPLRDVHARAVQGRHVRSRQQRLQAVHALPPGRIHALRQVRGRHGGYVPRAEDLHAVHELQRGRVQAQHVHRHGAVRHVRVRRVPEMPRRLLPEEGLRRIWDAGLVPRHGVRALPNVPAGHIQGWMQRRTRVRSICVGDGRRPVPSLQPVPRRILHLARHIAAMPRWEKNERSCAAEGPSRG